MFTMNIKLTAFKNMLADIFKLRFFAPTITFPKLKKMVKTSHVTAVQLYKLRN